MRIDQPYRRLACWGEIVSHPVSGLACLYGLTFAFFCLIDTGRQLVFALTLMIPLIWLSVEDIRKFEIPDLATGAVAGIALLNLVVFDPPQLTTHVGSAMVILAAFWALGEVHYRRTGQEGLGIGDAKLLAAGALLLGPEQLPEFLLLASVGGIIAVGVQRLRRSNTGAGIPFGPFIAYAMFVLFFLEPMFL